MDPVGITLTSGAIAVLVIELIKWVVRLVRKEPEYALPAMFYTIAIPVFNALAPFVLVAIGQPTSDPILGMTFASILQYLTRIVVASLVTLVGYNDGLKPLKEYRNTLKVEKELKANAEFIATTEILKAEKDLLDK